MRRVAVTWVLMESYLHTFCIHFILKNVRNERNKLGNKRNRLQNRASTKEIKIIYLKWDHALFSEIRKAKLYPPVDIQSHVCDRLRFRLIAKDPQVG